MKHSHATSSQFLLIICDSKGELEMHATSAFQGYRDVWIPEHVRREAKQIAVSAANEKKVRRRRDSAVDKRARQPEQSQGVDGGYDEWEDGQGKAMSHEERMLCAQAPREDDMEMHKKRPPQYDLEPTRTSKRKTVPRPEMPGANRRGSSGSDDMAEGMITEDYQPLVISDHDAVTTFYMTRLRQMQQLMCKVVAKAWIKVIEPKKQSNFPYNRGDESKPAWWPQDVRHKEPDHLMKPERLTLLLTMLRSRRVPIEKLEGATAEVMVQIPKERIPLLNEIYQVAKQEERFLRSELPPETTVFVAASEKIIRSPPSGKIQSPQMRRQSLASPTGPMQDRRMSVQSPPQGDMVNISDGRDMDMRVPSRIGSRDDTAGHNPYTGTNASSTEMDTSIGYTASYPQASMPAVSPLPDQPYNMASNLDQMRDTGGYFGQGSMPNMIRRSTTAAGWPTQMNQMNMYPPYSPGGSTPYGMPPHRQSASTPQTPIGGPFQGVHLPPPQPPQLGHRPSHPNLGGEQGAHQYDASGQMGPASHTNSLGFTEFLHRGDLPGEDGSTRVKME
jgi:hypothetical protein